MKFTIQWLQKHIEIPTLSSELLEKIEKTMTNLGIEVEEVNLINPLLIAPLLSVNSKEGLKVKKIQTTISSYLAEKLNYENNTFQVLCGDHSAKENNYGVLVPIGTSLGDFTIAQRTIKNEQSFGMFAASKEIGEKNNEDGIIQFSEKNTDIYRYDNIIFKVSVPTNRWDLQNVRGIARELANSGIGKLKNLDTAITENKFSLSIENNTDVFFTFCEVKKIQVKSLVRDFLKTINLDSASDLQCLNDFVLLDIGHAIHIYDKNLFENSNIYIEQAKSGDNIETFKGNFCCNGKEVLIKNKNKTLCVGGIIGSEGFNNQTQDVIIEAAYFTPENISELISASAKSFNLGIDCQQNTLAYVSSLINGEISQIVTTEKKEKELIEIFLSHGVFTNISGYELSIEEICSYLNSFGFSCVPQKKIIDSVTERFLFGINIIIPSWRNDIKIEEDLVEEILRIYGYDKLITHHNQQIQNIMVPEDIESKTRNFLVAQGFTEMYNFPFQKHQTEVEITNSIHVDYGYMRDTLFFSLLNNAQKLFAVGEFDCKLFEIGKIYPSEKVCLGIFLAGKKTQTLLQKGDYQFLDIKNYLYNLSQFINIGELLAEEKTEYFSNKISFQEGFIGRLGFIKNYDLIKNAYYLQIELKEKEHFMKQKLDKVRTYKNLNIECHKEILWQEVSQKIEIEHRLVDIFENDIKKAYTVTLIFEEYTDELFEKIKQKIEKCNFFKK